MKSWIIEHPRNFWGIYLYDDSSEWEIISDGEWYINACSPSGRKDIDINPGQHELLPSYFFIRTKNDKAFLIISERYDCETLVRTKKDKMSLTCQVTEGVSDERD